MSVERVSVMMIWKAGVAGEMLQLDSMCIISYSFFQNDISCISTSPSNDHYHLNICFFPCYILGIVLSQFLTLYIYNFY